MPRRYEMTTRAAAKERTRGAILDAAVELFTTAWFDEVTLADVAARAGVSQQTVVNHFGSKVGLYLTGLEERYAPAITDLRDRAVVGDVRSVVETVVADYETTGDGTFRLLGLAERTPELEPVLVAGRTYHRGWVEHVLGPQLGRLRGARRTRLVTVLTCLLDVTMWRQLRRVEGLDEAATADHLVTMVESALAVHASA